MLWCIRIRIFDDGERGVPLAWLATLFALSAIELALAMAELADTWTEVSASLADFTDTLA